MKIQKSIEMFIQYCENNGLSKTTVRTYASDLEQFTFFLQTEGVDVWETDIKDVPTSTLKAFFSDCKGRYATTTVRRKHAVLSSLYSWLVDECEYFDYNIIANIKLKFKHESKKQTVVRPEDVTAMLKVLDNVPKRKRNYKHYRNRLMVLMLFGCGLRVKELATLSFDRYNKSDKSFTIKAKGDKDHKIYIDNTDTLDAYKKVCEMVPEDCVWLFTADGKTHMSITAIAHVVRELARDAGLEKNITPHAFRRGCATALIENDVDLSIVKDVLGHSNITTTMRYVNLSEKKVKDTMKNHSPLNLI